MTTALRRVTSSSILNAMPHAVLVLDGEDNIVAANDAAQSFFQASLAYLRKRPLAAFVPFAARFISFV